MRFLRTEGNDKNYIIFNTDRGAVSVIMRWQMEDYIRLEVLVWLAE